MHSAPHKKVCALRRTQKCAPHSGIIMNRLYHHDVMDLTSYFRSESEFGSGRPASQAGGPGVTVRAPAGPG